VECFFPKRHVVTETNAIGMEYRFAYNVRARPIKNCRTYHARMFFRAVRKRSAKNAGNGRVVLKKERYVLHPIGSN
jgi:hypothetical protein